MEQRPGVRDARLVYHFWVDDSVVDHFGSTIGAHGLALYMTLARHARQGVAYPSYKRLMKLTGMSRSTVITYLKRLQDCNLISIQPRHTEEGDPTSNLYILLDLSQYRSRPSTPPVPGGTPEIPPGTPDIPPLVREVYGGGTPGIPEVVPYVSSTKNEVVMHETEISHEISSQESATPDPENGQPLAPEAIAGKSKRTEPPLDAEDWLFRLLEEYADDIPLPYFNSERYWTNLANTFQDFNYSWVSRGFASLVTYHETHKRRIPRNQQGWRRRMTNSLNWFYDHNVSRRGA